MMKCLSKMTLNEHDFDMPTIPHVTYHMVSDDKFMVAKVDEMVITSWTWVHIAFKTI